MADLENLLLEAAGRTGTGGRNQHSHPPSRRKREGSYSDGGSDSRDDDSDDDRGYASRKPSGSQVPLKKRLDPAERDDDQGNKRGDKKFTEKIRSKRENDKPSQSRRETPPLPSSRGVRSSARSADRAAAKDDALNELRAKRLKQQDPEAHRKLRDASKSSSGGRGSSPVKRKPFIASSLSSSSQSESESRSNSEDEGSTGDGGMADSEDERGTWGPNGPTFNDIKEITIRRSKSGPIYRLCMEEFRQLIREVERSGGRMPSKQDVLEKKEALQKAKTFVYSAATVKQMLQEKKSSSSRPLNIAAEKDRLRRDLEIALIRHDETEVQRIKKRLQQLEASRQSQEKDAKAIRLAEMNRKNRVENFKNASGLKPVNTGLKAGEAGYDPFSRRWTRSRNYYNAKAQRRLLMVAPMAMMQVLLLQRLAGQPQQLPCRKLLAQGN
ncbi:Protein RTF1-like protein [Hibiscus syriacus]|uniref:Protein RTF1-like protein n=1 Tax=Hibiscus syriacus TaxID=106335 RepID=A0A6A3CSG9_HIBSY|nr:Protein RTF1-like protein [Hibiscus syriacus]